VLHVAQPGHWLGPVTGPGWLGPAQPRTGGLSWAQPKKPKKIKTKKIESIEIKILHVLGKMYFYQFIH
jgi:hypothetical protein